MSDRYVVIVQTENDFFVYGPFSDYELAADYAKDTNKWRPMWKTHIRVLEKTNIFPMSR